MITLGILLTLLLGGSGLAALVLRRRCRRRGDLKRPRIGIARPATDDSATLGVWRPPPREHLLRRQEALSRDSGGDEAAPPYDMYRRRPMVKPLGRCEAMPTLRPRPPVTLGSQMRAEAPAPSSQPPTDTPGLTQQPSRIGRRRQGLESLITEIPQHPREQHHDSRDS